MTAEQRQAKRGRRPGAIGIVVSDRRDKTIKVIVETPVKHRQYGKYIRRRTICHAHDERNEARVGDTVELMESRRYSKTKDWRLVRIVAKSRAAEPASAPAGAEA